MLKIRFLVKIIENLTQTTWFFLDYLRIRRWKEFGIELAPDNHVPRRICRVFSIATDFLPVPLPSIMALPTGCSYVLLHLLLPDLPRRWRGAQRSAPPHGNFIELEDIARGTAILCLGARRGRKSSRVGDRGRRAATVMAEVRWNNDMRKKGIKVFAHLEFP